MAGRDERSDATPAGRSDATATPVGRSDATATPVGRSDATSVDEQFMLLALVQADLALATGDVPIGALIVDASGRILGAGRNRREASADPTAHAELLAVRQAALARGDWRLTGTTLYCTLEPCPMCAGALVNARVSRVVYGCDDSKGGGVFSLFAIGSDPRLNHRFELQRGVMKDACLRRLQLFFLLLRAGGEK
jgi:tRNA(adenine34) deaminase